ncbi:stage III sporulation protein AA [Paenibacillus aurantius]|uniref:Stage III sporulation protein AA n=1 Tax=Paenibacillus aurantius TaxID=2918900 RepID=A0AA96RFV6_9BACL|nr:stage III sporulation protein AA [Paenibacillus aurantius]WNQ09404.1 stage III sporulation protein AA [Paenibacillus aurantius]
MDSVLTVLPSSLKTIAARLPRVILSQLEEIRIRERRPLEIQYGGRSGFVSREGEIVPTEAEAYLPTREDCARLIDLLTHHSLYSFEEELRRGYITIAGGHRVGLSGRTVLEGGRVKLLRDIAGFNLRVAREVTGCAADVLPYLIDPDGATLHHTLVVSPPQQGKTTLIRDLARLVSSGWGPLPGRKVGIVDERSEIAACVRGVPHFNVGPRTDVLDSCPKAEGLMMMIRSLSPEVLMADEIGKPEDAEAIREARHAGIRVVATAHGKDLEDVKERPVLRSLCREGVFPRIVVLSKRGGRFESAVYDLSGRRLDENRVRPARGSANA